MLYQKKKKNVAIELTQDNKVCFNNMKSFYVDFHKHIKKTSNVFKNTNFVREFK